MTIKKKELHVMQHSFDWEWKKITFESWKLAPHADGSVKVTIWDTVLLCTAVMDKRPDTDIDFTPLMIDFRESFSAGGRIAGAAYRRREGRPSDNCTLYARLTDRTLRPLLPHWMVNNLIVSVTPLDLDQTQDLWVISILWCSLAILAAGIPLDGPVWVARVGRVDGQFVINPTLEQIKLWDINLIVAGPKWMINMIECDAKEVDEATIKEAFKIWLDHVNKVIDEQTKFLSQLTIKTLTPTLNNPEEGLLNYIHSLFTQDWKEQIYATNADFSEVLSAFEDEVKACCKTKAEENPAMSYSSTQIRMAVFKVVKNDVRLRTLNEQKRVDGRAMDEIRSLYCEVDVLPRVHGSSLFWRGETQVLNSITLWSPSDYLIKDSMEEDNIHQRFFHHYNFPPFSTNEARPTRGAWRREIGHGALAEKAIEPMIPSKEVFPYVIRSVSECLGSGGSTSMWSVCSATMALLAAWVPMIKPVSGIAMWMMSEINKDWSYSKHQILTDLKGTEDFMWDMDFKVAGTKDGITAIQLDTKVRGLTMDIVFETIEKANVSRDEILDFMLQTISTHRPETSPYAPKIFTFKIDPEKIRAVIGKWGEVINKIIDLCGGVKIDFEDDGSVFIADKDMEKIKKAEQMIRDIADDLPLNKEIQWIISKVENFWVFVKLPGWKSWLCHIKFLWVESGDITTKFKIWDSIKVIITEIDSKWRYNLKRSV